MNRHHTLSTILIIMVAALALAACGADPTPTPAPTPTATATPLPIRDIMVSIGQPFEMGPKHRAFVGGDGFIIDYVGVVSDSRCARDVQCITAGRAVVEFLISEDSSHDLSSYLFGIGDTGPEPSRHDIGDYHVSLVKLTPLPHSDGRALDYRATLVATRAPS